MAVSAKRKKAGSKTEKKSGVADPQQWFIDVLGGTPLASGTVVNAITAMTCAPVRCAVLAISEAMGQLPVHVYERGDNGARERAPDHPVHTLVHDEANEWTSASHLRESLTRDALLHGKGVAFINRIDDRPVELLRLDPTLVSIEADGTTGEPIYRLAEGRGERRTIPRQNILHLRAPGDVALIYEAREAVGLILAQDAYAARLFGNGARPSGLITFKGTLTADSVAKAKAAWQAAHGGNKSGGTAVLDNEATWHSLALSSVDAQFLEMRKFSIEEISRASRVPVSMLAHLERATHSNAEEMGRQFLTYCLLPWIKRWEGEIRLKLFTPDERKTFFAEFLIDDLLRADLATRMDAYGKAITARILNPNEARAAENRAPYVGGNVFANPNTTSPPSQPDGKGQ